MTEGAKVLVVDDDQELCELLTIRLEAAGYEVSVAHDVASALSLVDASRAEAIVLDLRLGSEDGFDVLDGVGKRNPDLPVLVLTAHGTIELAVEAMQKGAFGFVTKPFHDHDLLQKLGHMVESQRLRREVAGLRRLVGGSDDRVRLVGTSAAIESVREKIDLVATSDTTVLVLGESGTGKELVARAIHARSARSKAPFVAVNCAGLSPELLESTLFGHKRGAFTGAVADREGLFGAAKKGTLFLDEIGETPVEVQAKLLRVLQEKRYVPLGATTELEADVRIVAATNRDLKQEVAEKRFREDLYYRLHVVPLFVPPLRERVGDALLLAEMFLERAAARAGVPAPKFSARALGALRTHSWPGNVRELENVMEAAVVLCRTGEVDLDHLPGVGVPTEAPEESKLTTAVTDLLQQYRSSEDPPLPSLKEARDALERAYLLAALERSNGNVTAAARMAGRNRTDFYDLMRRHDCSPAFAKR